MKIFRNQKGVSIAIFAISATVLIGMAALGVDVGMIVTARNQLQSVVDGSALAAATGLQVSQNEAISRGISIAQANSMLEESVNLAPNNFNFIGIDQVQVSSTRPVNLFFSQFFGLDQTQVTASATAQMGNRDIVLIFDRSGSMDDDTVNPKDPQPISDTQNAALFFVKRIKNNTYVDDQLGLVSYSTDAALEVKLGHDYRAMRRKIKAFTANGWTNVGDAIKIANEELVNSNRGRVFKYEILLSDGIANRPLGVGDPKKYALAQADGAKLNGIKIFTISLGANADQNLMQQIADKTDAEHYYSPTTKELRAIFDEIAKKIPARLIG